MVRAVITGASCLTSAGLDPAGLAAALSAPLSGIAPVSTAKDQTPDVLAGLIGSLDEEIKAHVPTKLKRRMNRLSLMSCVAVGQALASAGISGSGVEETGLILATAFGGTSQCALFYGGLLDEGERLVNPAHFPETVPSAPAGQAAICFGLKGPSTTVCQQSLSSEYALFIAQEMIASGMAERLVVLAVEEMCPALLSGFAAMGIVKRPDEMTGSGVRLSPRTLPGEGAVALVLEHPGCARKRGAAPWAELARVEAGGGAFVSARYGRPGPEAAEYAKRACRECGPPDMIVTSGSFVRQADQSLWEGLGRAFGPDALAVAPEYATGHLFGAGLARVVLGAYALTGNEIPCASLSTPLPEIVRPSGLFTRTARASNLALVSSACPGGGASAIVLRRI